MESSSTRIRPRLSRTFSRGRWREYRRFLELARGHRYQIVSLETWIENGQGDAAPTLILRHDVDQHPRSALTMAAVEEELGIRSSWYFRWRTAHPSVVSALRRSGFDVGLHYETLTRNALERGSAGPVDDTLLERSRGDLRAEISAFANLFGPLRSVVPHGDSRIPEVHNADLLQGENCEDYGIEFDGNEAMRGRRLGHWLTDRSAAEGHWKDGIDPAELFASGASPILCVTHPNNWASGPSLWLDRVLGALLPAGPVDSNRRPSRPIRTGSDQPAQESSRWV
jgi:hypothetical protein